jgi:hypothetical protein
MALYRLQYRCSYLFVVSFDCLAVNHYMVFVAWKTAYSTNTIEGIWSPSKVFIPAKFHITECLIPMDSFANLCTYLYSKIYWTTVNAIRRRLYAALSYTP